MTTPPARSCTDCVFNLTELQQSVHIRQSIGSPMCGKGKGPTSIPTATRSQAEGIAAEKARTCDSYSEVTFEGENLGPEVATLSIVMLPDPTVLAAAPVAPNAVKSCLQCSRYIPGASSLEAGLWNVGICSARGIMIPTTQVVAAAASCTNRSVGPRDPSSITRMQLLPEYSVGMNIGTIPAGGIVAPEDGVEFIDPVEYPTDQPVSDEDKATGIRAWRKIEDPESENAVYLPIYDIDFFDEVDRSAIPRTNDDEHPEKYVDHMGLAYKAAVLWLHLNETPALWGVAGTGKTEFYRYMAWLMCLPFNRISFTHSMEIEDLAGKMHYEPSRGTYFEYGRMPKAWSKPGVICLDEPNVGPPDVWQFIRPLTDNSKQLVLDMNNGERISRHPSAFLGLAMNPAWDVRNTGTESLADADGSRLMHIFVDLPDAKTERRIIRERCALDGYDIPESTLDSVMKIAVDLRALCKDETLPITWGIRPQIKVARALKWFSPAAAYRLATADYLEPEAQQIILDVVKTHIRSSRPPIPVAGASKRAASGLTGGMFTAPPVPPTRPMAPTAPKPPIPVASLPSVTPPTAHLTPGEVPF